MTAYYEFSMTCGCGETLAGIAVRKTLTRWLKAHQYSMRHLKWEAKRKATLAAAGVSNA